MKGADLVIEVLIRAGVSVCFGYPGGAAMPLYDSLYKRKNEIRHIRSAHEQGAAHAADGYARASGRLGVCIATSGPGATNLVTGIATAYADSVPVLFITANVASAEIGTDSFQEADIAGITTPVCKYNWTVREPEKLVNTLKKAIFLSTSGRPGPTLVDIPTDILSFEFGKNYNIDGGELTEGREARLPESCEIKAAELERVAQLINNSSRPVLLCGGGVRISGAFEEIKGLAEKTGSPVATTLMAVGTLPYGHPLNFGMVGEYGAGDAARIINAADLIIAVGVRFSNRTHNISGGEKTVIHIDNDASEINKNIHAAAALVGDAKKIIRELLPFVSEKKPWMPSSERTSDSIFSMLSEALGKNAFVVTDVGNHQMRVANYYPFETPGSFITSGGFGTMGFGLGAAIGCRLAREDVPAVLITGDGSFKMNLTELATLKENGLRLLIIVMNNASLGMVRDMQKKKFGRRYIATEGRKRLPDFGKIASAYGIKSAVARTEKDLRRALESYKSCGEAFLIDLRL